jgi:uncharacterized protein YdhG (YjbR/CyaY superfamily)
MSSSVVQAYLSKLPLDEQKALGALRELILQVAPSMEERLSRGVPFFYYKGKRAVGFRSSKTHLSFFIMEGNVLKELQKEIAHLNFSSTVIRFTPENPLPKQIVVRLVRARIEEIESQIKK